MNEEGGPDMNAQLVARMIEDGSLYPLGIVYLTEPPPCSMEVVHTIEEIKAGIPFLVVLVNVEEN